MGHAATRPRDRATLATGPAGRNFRRWPVLDQRLWQAPRAPGSLNAEVRSLRRFMDRRIAWMDHAIGSLRCWTAQRAMPAATVSFVASSMRTNAPVTRFRA